MSDQFCKQAGKHAPRYRCRSSSGGTLGGCCRLGGAPLLGGRLGSRGRLCRCSPLLFLGSSQDSPARLSVRLPGSTLRGGGVGTRGLKQTPCVTHCTPKLRLHEKGTGQGTWHGWWVCTWISPKGRDKLCARSHGPPFSGCVAFSRHQESQQRRQLAANMCRGLLLKVAQSPPAAATCGRRGRPCSPPHLRGRAWLLPPPPAPAALRGLCAAQRIDAQCLAPR